MSSTPLLPSYDAATRHVRSRNEDLWAHLRAEARGRITLDVLCAILFPGNAIVASIWATRSGTAAPMVSQTTGPRCVFFDLTTLQIPPDSVPLLPYFAFLFLVLSFSFWVGYLISIGYEVSRIPHLHHRIVVWGSVGGKLLLAGVHSLVWVGYMRFFAEWPQPNWVIVFLAAQAWWDVFLFVIYWCLTVEIVWG